MNEMQPEPDGFEVPPELPLADRLDEGTILRQKRWSGDTFHEFASGEIDDDATNALMAEAAAQLRELENDGEGPPEGGVEPTEAQPEVPSAPSPLPERTYHGMSEREVRERALVAVPDGFVDTYHLIRDACRAKVAEWDRDPDLVPVMLSREDAERTARTTWVEDRNKRLARACRAALEALQPTPRRTER